MEWKKDKTLGYVYALVAGHPLANSQGKVYQHVFVMANKIGRPLQKDEVVHHVDRDRSNNDLKNLRLMTKSEHCLLHAIEDRGHSPAVESSCRYCGKLYTHPASVESKYCSCDCSYKGARKFEITREELHTLVWSMPTLKVADLLGVSDVAIAKRCKKLGITKPPRGYWRKVEAGLIIHKIPELI